LFFFFFQVQELFAQAQAAQNSADSSSSSNEFNALFAALSLKDASPGKAGGGSGKEATAAQVPYQIFFS
jgi:hypothetical protein